MYTQLVSQQGNLIVDLLLLSTINPGALGDRCFSQRSQTDFLRRITSLLV